jgi:predicted  nucleic acid-binding Zn-ribbon protein
MTAIRNVLICIALVAVSVFFATASYTVVTVGKHASQTLMALDDTIEKLNGKNGLIQEVGKAVVDTKNLVAHSDHLLAQEEKSLDVWNTQVNNTLISIQATSQQTAESESAMSHAAVDTTAALEQTIRDAQPVLASTNAELQALQTTTEHLDVLVTDPHLTSTIANVDSTTSHINATSNDVQEVVHSYLHPTWAHRIFGWALDVAHALNPL